MTAIAPIRQRGGQPKLTPAQKVEAVDRFIAGELVEDIAASYGVTRTTIYHLTEEAGAVRPKPKAKPPQNGWTADEDAKMIEMQLDGRTASQIGKVVGRSRNSVISRLHRLKIYKQQVAAASSRPKMAATASTGLRTGRGNPGQANASGILKRALQQPPTAAPEIIKIEARDIWKPLPGTVPVSLLDHQGHQCRWPVGDRLYCGQEAERLPDGMVHAYCPTHRQRSIGHVAG